MRKDARFCPRCGRFFSSVKCPKCGHVGRADDFDLGCPSCGHALPANPAPEPIKELPPRLPAPPLPWWAIPAASLAAIGLLVALLLSLR